MLFSVGLVFRGLYAIFLLLSNPLKSFLVRKLVSFLLVWGVGCWFSRVVWFSFLLRSSLLMVEFVSKLDPPSLFL